MIDDLALLRRYLEDRSEASFAELVQRHLNLVYFAALRQVDGDAALAEEVTQSVFADLARKAAELVRRSTITGWLYTSTRFAALKARRAEQRRQVREEKAHIMDELTRDDATAASVEWEQLRPVIDDALHALDERDREAVLLRFFEGRPFAEVGAELALSEDTARVRVNRALEKMRVALDRRGVNSTTAALAVAMGGQAALAAPAGLAASVVGAAAAGAAAGVASGGWLVGFMTMSKLQVGIIGVIAAAGVAGYVVQAETNATLRKEIAGLQGQQEAMTALRTENRQLASVAAEVEVLRRDDAELKRLGEEVAAVKKVNEETAQKMRLREAEQTARADIERMNKEGNTLVQEFQRLTQQSMDSSLSAEAREAARIAAQGKMVEIQAKKREIDALAKATQAGDGSDLSNRSTYRSPETQAMRAQVEQMNQEGNALVQEYTSQMDAAKNPSISAEERAAAARMAQEKVAAIQAKRREIAALSGGTQPEAFAGLSPAPKTMSPQEEEARAQIERMNQETKGLSAEYTELTKRVENSSLDTAAREEAAVAARQKLAAMQAKLLEVEMLTKRAQASGALPISLPGVIRAKPNGGTPTTAPSGGPRAQQ